MWAGFSCWIKRKHRDPFKYFPFSVSWSTEMWESSHLLPWPGPMPLPCLLIQAGWHPLSRGPDEIFPPSSCFLQVFDDSQEQHKYRHTAERARALFNQHWWVLRPLDTNSVTRQKALGKNTSTERKGVITPPEEVYDVVVHEERQSLPLLSGSHSVLIRNYKMWSLNCKEGVREDCSRDI